MRFGVYAGPSFPSADVLPPEAALDYAGALAETARSSGLDGVFVGQHYLVGPDIQIFQPLTILPYLIARSPGMYFGTCVFLLPLLNPVAVAEHVAAIDIMTRGKFLFGIGQGYLEAEFNSFGIERASATRRLVEAIRAVRTLWEEDVASFEGEFYRFRDVCLSIRPIKRKGPPILLAADTLKSVARVPERGTDLWMISPRHSREFLRVAVPTFRNALEKKGIPFRGLPMPRDLWIADSRQEADRTIASSFERYYRQYVRWGQPGERYDLDFDQLKQGRVILGTPEEVTDEIIAYHDEFGVEFMWFRVYWPGMQLERSLEVIRRLGAEVLPRVRARTTESGPW